MCSVVCRLSQFYSFCFSRVSTVLKFIVVCQPCVRLCSVVCRLCQIYSFGFSRLSTVFVKFIFQSSHVSAVFIRVSFGFCNSFDYSRVPTMLKFIILLQPCLGCVQSCVYCVKVLVLALVLWRKLDFRTFDFVRLGCLNCEFDCVRF